MTEQEWLTATDIGPMLDHLGNRLTPRKLRLFACGSARRTWILLEDDSKGAVEVAERFADGLASPADLLLAFQVANTLWSSFPNDAGGRRTRREPTEARRDEKTAAWLARNAANPDLNLSLLRHYSWKGVRSIVSPAALLRELFGPLPFRAVEVAPAWLEWNGGAAAGLAATIDEEGTFDLMPVLGDALEDAGCEDAAILDHLRGRVPHVRGCWALDLVLGRR